MKYFGFLSVFLLCLCISGSQGYNVIGNKIYDPTGKQVTLRGVDRPSFEWSVSGEMASASDYALMAQWGANVVRLATNQDFWLSSSTGATYQANIAQQVTWATQAKMGIILDLHWNNGGQQNMADRNSITYWTQVATQFKGNPWVMFELYNEPHDVSWSQWLNGDSNYAGMQEMYNAVRATGANNTAIVGGLNWAFDLSGVGAGYAVKGSNIAYATHPYDYDGKQVTDWPTAFGYLAPNYVVVMTEFGQYCNSDTYVQDLLQYAQTNSIHWTAWAWYVSGCSFPSIISDWSGTAISGVGELVKSYLSGNAPLSTSAPSSGSSTGSSTATSPASPATSALNVYVDGLASGWQDWSWATSYSLSDTTYTYSGSSSAIKFVVQGYQGIYLHATSPFTIGSYNTLQFYVNGGSNAVSASSLAVKIYGTSSAPIGNVANFPASVPASQWSLISIPISSFGVSASTQVAGIVIMANVNNNAGTIWVDNISFLPAASQPSTTAPTQAPAQPVTQAPTTKATTPAPTQASTPAPTQASTQAPTKAATVPPTQPAVNVPPTVPATSAPATAAPTSGCTSANVQLAQSVVSSWQSNGQTITQYNLVVSTTCANKRLVGLTLSATNWNPVSFWNIQATTSSSSGQATLALPSYAVATPTSPFTVGYQNVGQATFTITSVTFQ